VGDERVVDDEGVHGLNPTVSGAYPHGVSWPGLSRWDPDGRDTARGGIGVDNENIDFAFVAYREEGVWQLHEIVDDVLDSVDEFAAALRRFPGDGGAIGVVAVDEDFFVLLRVAGARTRVLLSDVTAADEWEIARSALEALDLPLPDDEDDQEPAGDLGLLADLGMNAMDLGLLLDDFDLYPDEMVSEIARKLGFGRLFDDAVGLTSA
jgi:putative tRNA adenosine deaminase-associated protein